MNRSKTCGPDPALPNAASSGGSLPEPDKYGTYWLTSPKSADGKEVPSPWAIFRSKRLICGVVSECDCWYLLAGENGIVWDGPAPKWFLSVAAAFREAARLGFLAVKRKTPGEIL